MMWNKRWLWQALQQPPPDGGLWNGRKVADWMSELKGEKVCRLHRVGISQVHEVSIESTSPLSSGIRSPRTGGMEKKIYTVKSRESRKNTLQAT
jgi:hypothetical protein